MEYLASYRDEIKAFASGTTVDIHRNGNDLQLDINEGTVVFLFFLQVHWPLLEAPLPWMKLGVSQDLGGPWGFGEQRGAGDLCILYDWNGGIGS